MTPLTEFTITFTIIFTILLVLLILLHHYTDHDRLEAKQRRRSHR